LRSPLTNLPLRSGAAAVPNVLRALCATLYWGWVAAGDKQHAWQVVQFTVLAGLWLMRCAAARAPSFRVVVAVARRVVVACGLVWLAVVAHVAAAGLLLIGGLFALAATAVFTAPRLLGCRLRRGSRALWFKWYRVAVLLLCALAGALFVCVAHVALRGALRLLVYPFLYMHRAIGLYL
jgi:hypothetical protein